MLKRATNRCNLFYTIAALRQNELKSDVARFTTTNQTCLATIQVVVGCEKFLQNVESGSTFWIKSVHVVRFTGTRQTCFAASDVTTVNGVSPA